MTPDYKALCAELLAVFDNYDDESNLVGIFDDMKANKNDLLERARLALAAEPEPPVNGEVAELSNLKDRALKALQFVDEKLDLPLHNHCNAIHTIRIALEALPND